MRVRAVERGYYDMVLREPGAEFEVPDKLEASWFKSVEPVRSNDSEDRSDQQSLKSSGKSKA